MTLHGKFTINDADYSPLAFDGIGVFMAFSGNGAYRNKGACGIIPNVGPLLDLPLYFQTPVIT